MIISGRNFETLKLSEYQQTAMAAETVKNFKQRFAESNLLRWLRGIFAAAAPLFDEFGASESPVSGSCENFLNRRNADT